MRPRLSVEQETAGREEKKLCGSSSNKEQGAIETAEELSILVGAEEPSESMGRFEGGREDDNSEQEDREEGVLSLSERKWRLLAPETGKGEEAECGESCVGGGVVEAEEAQLSCIEGVVDRESLEFGDPPTTFSSSCASLLLIKPLSLGMLFFFSLSLLLLK